MLVCVCVCQVRSDTVTAVRSVSSSVEIKDQSGSLDSGAEG